MAVSPTLGGTKLARHGLFGRPLGACVFHNQLDVDDANGRSLLDVLVRGVLVLLLLLLLLRIEEKLERQTLEKEQVKKGGP